jgi:hypothetical protein
MPAEQGSREHGGTMDDRDRGHQAENIRGIGDREQPDEEFEDAEEEEDTEDSEDEPEEGSF